MLLRQQPGRADEALDAYERFIRVAGTGNDAAIAFAQEELAAAGRPVPEPAAQDDQPDESLLLEVERGGKRTAIVVRNDAGVNLDALQDVLARFSEAATWVDAYLILREHPEVSSGLALSVFAINAEDSTADAQIARANLRVLERAREAGPEAAFAEAEGMSVDEFRVLVRGIDQIQPVLMQTLTEQGLGQLDALLDRRPDIAEDPATDVLLHFLWQRNSAEGREVIDWVRHQIDWRRQSRGIPEGAVAEYRHRVNESDQDTAVLDELAVEGERLLATAPARDRANVRLDLALVMKQRYELLERPDDLYRAITLLREGLQEVGADSRFGMPFLSNLGGVLMRAYELEGDEERADEAIACLRAAREIAGDHSVNSPIINGNLGVSLFRKAERTSDPAVRDESIALLERVVDATDPEEPIWRDRQANLATALLLRAEAGDQVAIDRVLRMTIDLHARTGDSDPRRGNVLNVLGRAFRTAFEWTGDVQQLTAAIDAYRELLERDDLTPSLRSMSRGNLGNALRRLFDATGAIVALDEAVDLLQASLQDLTPRPSEFQKQLSNLANVYLARAQAHENADDLSQAISLYRDVLAEHATTPEVRRWAAGNLGSVLFRVGIGNRDAALTQEGAELWSDALTATEPEADPGYVLDMSREVGSQLAAVGSFEDAARVLRLGLRALEAADRLSASSPARSRLLARAGDVVQLAAFVLARTGDREGAVVTLERGRARALREALDLDVSSLDELVDAGRADLAQSYAARAEELMALQMHHERDIADRLEPRIRELRTRIDELVQAIRTVPGFASFARRADIATVHRAACDSPLIYGSVTDLGATLLIVGEEGDISELDLPELTTAVVDVHAEDYFRALDSFREKPDSQAIQEIWAGQLLRTTEWLGDALGPLFALLATRQATQCVTLLPGRLGLLPLCAARTSDEPRYFVDDVGCKSAPSAEALLAAARVASTATVRSALVVGDPAATKEPALEAVAAELAAVHQAFSHTTTLTAGAAIPDRVLAELANHDVVHFACHGLGDPDAPMQGHLLLANGERLFLRDFLKNRVWSMRLCFLSACDTGVVGSAVPDEVVGFPSGLMQAGAAGVIASQWPVWDVAAAVLAISFYGVWPKRDPSPARALHEAQRWIRIATSGAVIELVRDRVTGEGADTLVSALQEFGPDETPFSHPVDWAGFIYVGA
jgi:CHAT domain-containing protein/tetratricopeptide (TPR) repeat protein